MTNDFKKFKTAIQEAADQFFMEWHADHSSYECLKTLIRNEKVSETMPNKAIVSLTLDKSKADTLLHALSVAAHHYQACTMFGNVPISVPERLSNITAYENVFAEILAIALQSGWRHEASTKKKSKRKEKKQDGYTNRKV